MTSDFVNSKNIQKKLNVFIFNQLDYLEVTKKSIPPSNQHYFLYYLIP